MLTGGGGPLYTTLPRLEYMNIIFSLVFSCTACTSSRYRCAWCMDNGACEYEDNIDATTCDPRVYGLQVRKRGCGCCGYKDTGSV